MIKHKIHNILAEMLPGNGKFYMICFTSAVALLPVNDELLISKRTTTAIGIVLKPPFV